MFVFSVFFALAGDRLYLMPQALRTEPHQSIDTLTSMPITLNISDDIVRRLEVAAQLRSITPEELATQVLTDNTPHINQNPQILPITEDEKLAMQELKTLLKSRIERAERGEFSDKTPDQIFDEVMQEEETKEREHVILT
jgi:hypothetical protein